MIILAPISVALVLDLGLRLIGYGYPTGFFLRNSPPGICRDNRKFTWQFYSPKAPLNRQPVLISTRKPPGVIRIFVLGESAALGTPEPSFGFARILERMLRQQYPHTRFEVVNAAVRGINSYIILPIAKDCAALDPDLFIAYIGNNEVIGLHAPGPDGGTLTPYLRLLRTIQWLKTTRLGQCLSVALTRADDPYAADRQDMVFFRNHRLAADDPRRAAVYRNFRSNLEDICRLIARSHARLVLSTVAVNLRDSPPFGSLHRTDLTDADRARWEEACGKGVAAENSHRVDEAIGYYQRAERLDDHFADLHFRLGRCDLAAGRFAEARREYALARDWDALQFRADRRVNQIIRQVATEAGPANVTLVDAESAFAHSPLSDHGLPGEALFYEHAHLRFDGDYLLAQTLYPAVVAALAPKLGPAPATPIPSRDRCAADLAFTRLDEARLNAAMLEVPTQPPFLDQLDRQDRLRRARETLNRRFGDLSQSDLQNAIQTYQDAIQKFPDDWQLHYNFASLDFRFHDIPAATRQFQLARALMPFEPSIAMGLSRSLAESGRFDEAVACLKVLLRQDPDYQPAKQGLDAVKSMRQRRASAALPGRQSPP